MAKRAYLRIEGNIGEPDEFLKMLGVEDGSFSAKDMSKFLSDNASAKEVEIEIRSNGGSLDEAFDIYDQLIASGKKIITKGFRVNSAATVIHLAAEKPNRTVSSNVQYIIHNPYISNLSGSFGAKELKDLAANVEKYESKLLNFYVERLGLNEVLKTEIKNLMVQDTDLGKDKALHYGFGSSVITVANGTKDNSVQGSAVAYTEEMVSIMKAHANNNNKNTSMKGKQKSKFIAGISALYNQLANFIKVINASVTIKDSETQIYFAEDEIGEGIAVFSDEAMETPMADGEYTLSNDTVISVEGGMIKTITEAVEDKTGTEGKIKNASVEAEGGVMIYFAEEAIAVGVAVFSDEAMTTPMADDEYILTDATVCVVVEGKVESLSPVMDAYKALKQKNIELENQINTKSAEVTNLTNGFKDMKAKVDAFKAAMLSGVNPNDDDDDDDDKTPPKPMNAAQQYLHNKRELKKHLGIKDSK